VSAAQTAAWQSGEIGATGSDDAHPLDEAARARGFSQSRLDGRGRAGVDLIRIATGGRAHPHHRPRVEEEWPDVPSGTGALCTGGETVTLGAGGFAAFQPGGTAHSAADSSDDTPLVRLRGGESRPHEVVEFREAGRRVSRGPDGPRIAPLGDAPFGFFPVTPLTGADEGGAR